MENNKNYKFNLVYFVSEGQPYDNGLKLTDNIQLVEKYASQHFDHIEYYTPRKLVNMGFGSYVKDYKEIGLTTQNLGMTRIGNSAWKPKIMLLELQKMNYGDILIYRDSNISKYKQLGNYDNIRLLAEKCLEICEFDFFISRDLHEYTRTYEITKTNIIRELGDNHEFTYDFPIVCGYFLIVRKSSISIELLTEWDKACQIEKWIDPFQYGDLHPNFQWSCNEQSIICVIIANWIRKRKHNIPLKYPFIAFEERDIQKPKLCINYDYLKHLN